MGLGLFFILIIGLGVLAISIPMMLFGIKTVRMDMRAKENSNWIAGEDANIRPLWKRVLSIIVALLGTCGTVGTLFLLFVGVKGVLDYMMF